MGGLQGACTSTCTPSAHQTDSRQHRGRSRVARPLPREARWHAHPHTRTCGALRLSRGPDGRSTFSAYIEVTDLPVRLQLTSRPAAAIRLAVQATDGREPSSRASSHLDAAPRPHGHRAEHGLERIIYLLGVAKQWNESDDQTTGGHAVQILLARASLHAHAGERLEAAPTLLLRLVLYEMPPASPLSTPRRRSIPGALLACRSRAQSESAFIVSAASRRDLWGGLPRTASGLPSAAEFAKLSTTRCRDPEHRYPRPSRRAAGAQSVKTNSGGEPTICARSPGDRTASGRLAIWSIHRPRPRHMTVRDADVALHTLKMPSA